MHKVGLIALVGLLQVSCADPRAMNEKNIITGLQQYLGSEGAYCLGLSEWPATLDQVQLGMQDIFPQGLAAKMAALQSLGLVKGQPIELESVDFDGKHHVGKRYALTDMGKKFYRSASKDGDPYPHTADLCFAGKALDQLKKWTPADKDASSDVSVHYTYTVVNIPDWANSPTFKTVFSSVVDDMEHPVPEARVMVLADAGWQVQIIR